MRTFRYIIPVFIPAAVVVSCTRLETLPAEPHIEFRSFAVFDTTDILGNDIKGGRLKFYFEDGDGDIGLDPPYYEGDDSVNLFFTLYRKTGIAFTEVVDTLDALYPSDYRIPYMERLGQNKILKGIIAVTFLYQYYEPENTDTIKYKFSIKDRNQHYSDTVTTVEIPLSVNGIYINEGI